MAYETGLRGARVLVTAASRGIGFAAARAFLEEGARVVANSSNPAALGEVVGRLRSSGEVEGIPADLTRQEELDRLVCETRERLGGIDCLVYVTGSPVTGTVMEHDFARWQEAANLLTVSPAYLARKVAEVMLAGGTRGRMVFLASFAIREPVPNLALSNVCRIAIAGLVRTLARELGPRGIRTNGILPGYIATERVGEVIADGARRRGVPPEDARAELERAIPLGRLGTPEELARAILFFGSELSSYVNGALLPVDGGLLHSVG